MTRRPGQGAIRRITTALVIVVSVAACNADTPSRSGPTVPATMVVDGGTVVPVSRAWILQVQKYVKADKPSPPGAARLYAYVAKAYADTRDNDSVNVANEVARRVSNAVFPTHVAETDAFAATVAPPVEQLPKQAQRVAEELIERSQTDNWQADNNEATMATAPKGPQYWSRRTNAGPFAPSAGTWQRWIVPVDTNFDVPPPPAYGSPAFVDQLAQVAKASAQRTGEQVAIINYYGGVPGTEGPAGIWLNQLWKRVDTDAIATDDRRYSQVQSVLAQTLADAFMECWEVKYQYWTARPDMVDPNIKPSMPNPPFPSYVSGHSTISAAGATVLGSMLPDHKAEFLADAEQARDSRLWAGIHFPVDNEQGFALGTKVGNTVAERTKVNAK